MRIFVLFLLSTLVSFGQVTKEVRYFNTTGIIQQPLNFLATNILAGTNTFIEVNALGQVTINASVTGGSGSGDVTTSQLLVVSNQVQVSSNYFSEVTTAISNTFRTDINGLPSGGITNGQVLTNIYVYDGLTLANNTINRPPTNHITIGKDSYAGRGLLEWWDDQGLSIATQPWFGNNRITMYVPSATTVIGAFGLTIPVNLGGVTVSHPPPTEQWPYMVQLATAATSNACAGTFSSIDMTTMGTRYGMNGYFLATEFLTTNRLNQSALTAPAGNRLFIGRTSTASPALTNIVNTTNGTGQYAGLCVDSGFTNEFFLTVRDGTAQFRTNTGMLFVATNLYQFYMMQAPTSRMLSWKIKNMTSNTVQQGWFSNNVPTNMMKFGYLIRNGTTVVNSIRFSKIYVEAPLSP